MCQVVGAVLRGICGQRIGDGLDEGFEGSCGVFSQSRFELGEGLFDRVEVGAVGGQIDRRRAGALDCFSDTCDLVAGQIIHDDEIAAAQGRYQKLLDIGEEARPVHRPIEHTGSGDLVVSQGGDECCRLPMAMRHRPNEALTTPCAAIAPRHVGLCSGFINEHKPLWLQMPLQCMPLLTRLDDIGAVLLGGAQ